MNWLSGSIDNLTASSSSWNSRKSVLKDVITSLLVGAVFGLVLIFWDREDRINELQFNIQNEFDTVLREINSAANIAAELGLYVTIHGEITQSQLELFYKSMELTLEPDQIPLSIQIAPNGIVELEAPWTDGPHIGHDLFSDPERKTEAIAAAERLTSVIAGPVELKQGGTALIVRHPIITDLDSDTPEVWGLAIALIDWVPIAQRISEIEKHFGAQLEVYVKTISGTRIAYPEISEVAKLPFDRAGAQFGLGSIHYSFNAQYGPSSRVIMQILGITALIYLLIAGRGRRENKRLLVSYKADLRKAEALLAASTSAYTIVDENFERVLISEEAMKLFGYSDTEAPVPYASMYTDLTDDELQGQLQRLRELETGKILEFPKVYEMQTPDGIKRYVRMAARWFPNPIGEGRLLWNSLYDVTALVIAQQRLANLVNQDELTGLTSRRGLKEEFADGKRETTVAVYILDLDHFKSVNDSYGHDAGDRLLRAIGQTMLRMTETAGRAARLGGEEFAIIRPWQGWEEAREFGEALRRAIELTVVEDGPRKLSRSASIGIAKLVPSDTLFSAMNLADHLARSAKERGRNLTVAGGQAELQALEQVGAFITFKEVQLALEAGEFFYAVQPIWDVEKQYIEGFEALLRWRRPNGEQLSPAQFVNVFDEVTREPAYTALNTAMRKDVFANLSDFPEAYVSFNFRFEQLAYSGASKDVMNVFEAAKDFADRVIMIELSENAFSNRGTYDILQKELGALAENGFVIALDDFGVESSNLNRLQDYPIHVVKIDKSFTELLETSSDVRSMVRGLAMTIRNMRVKIIVEGVETVRQARTLMHYKVYSQQGYLHAKPMLPEQVAKRLEKIGRVIPGQLSIHDSPNKLLRQIKP